VRVLCVAERFPKGCSMKGLPWRARLFGCVCVLFEGEVLFSDGIIPCQQFMSYCGIYYIILQDVAGCVLFLL
jgi:hypothetical protein